jgi:membrane protease YdiL (CAAX protease family)
LTNAVNIPYKEAPRGSNTMHPALQFLLFIAILVVALMIGTFIGLAIVYLAFGMDTMMSITTLNISAPHFVSALWIVQFAGTTFPILVTPVFFAFVVMHDPANYLRTSFRFPLQLLAIVLVIMFFSFPLIEFLSNVNQRIPLPNWLKWLEANQATEEKLMTAMLSMKSVWDMVYDVLFIGLLTAVVEEFMFRGCLQTIFERWTKNIHVAIWVTAILFSAFHMDYFGFLPRVMLGALFGYFVAWSGSVWTSVWAHFINNGTIVVVTYLYQSKNSKISPDDNHVFNYPAYIISFIIILFLFWIYRRAALYNKPALQ